MAYAMVTAEGTLPAHGLYVTDGSVKRGFTDCLIDRCDIEVDQTGSATAELTAFSIANEAKDLTVTYDTEAPITKKGFTAVEIGLTSIAKFTSLRFGVVNNIARVPTGTTDVITELFARDPNYSGRLTFLKTASQPIFNWDATLKQNVLITIQDNQATPVSKTFTFTLAAMRSNPFDVEELNETYERIDWQGDKVTIA
jgi:hypothetical protein